MADQLIKAHVGNFKGTKGDKGDPGATGPQGAKGATGAAGPQGAKGDTGPTGPQGTKGDKGDTGSTGPQGAKGATGTRGSQWFNGTGVTGTSTTATIFSGSGVASALVGDYYVNSGTGADRGRVYRCTTAGAASAAKWVYTGSIQGPQGPQGIQGPIGPAGPNSADLISIIDTAGAKGAVGANTNMQALIDAIADKVMTKLLAKTAIVQTESTDTTTVPSSAYFKQVADRVNSDLGDGKWTYGAYINNDYNSETVENFVKDKYAILQNGTVTQLSCTFNGYKCLVTFFRVSASYGYVHMESYDKQLVFSLSNNTWREFSYVLNSDLNGVSFDIAKNANSNKAAIIVNKDSSGYFLGLDLDGVYTAYARLTPAAK